MISVAVGLTVFFSILWMTGPARHDMAMVGYANASVIAMVGIGLFFSSRFLPPPPSDHGMRT